MHYYWVCDQGLKNHTKRHACRQISAGSDEMSTPTKSLASILIICCSESGNSILIKRKKRVDFWALASPAACWLAYALIYLCARRIMRDYLLLKNKIRPVVTRAFSHGGRCIYISNYSESLLILRWRYLERPRAPLPPAVTRSRPTRKIPNNLVHRCGGESGLSSGSFNVPALGKQSCVSKGCFRVRHLPFAIPRVLSQWNASDSRRQQ